MSWDNFLNKLNGDQQKAVTHTKGPAIILAGAGSGKTRVLTYKVLCLVLEKNIHPSNILAVTFTNKAAGEMLERITSLISSQKMVVAKKDLPTIGTFHAICSRILRRDGKFIGIIPGFIIYDEKDQLDLIKQAFSLLDISLKEISPKSCLQTISLAKNELVDPVIYSQYATGNFQKTVARIYPLYQKLMKENQALDFDDLLLETIRLFGENPNILEKYQNQFLHILVDEYQDTNHVQYSLTKLLAAKHRNICIVGDFSQSIYSFRGADFRNLEKFKTDFPDAQVFKLSQNYRSTQKILDAAYSVISNNTTHPVLSLWTQNQQGEDIAIYQAENEHAEAEFIIRTILEEKSKKNNFSLSDVAVLYRMNAQSRILEEVFLHHSIPYVLVGGTRFYERKEIKDILSYLVLLVNPKDSVSKKRVEKIGKKRSAQFLEFVKEFNEKNYQEKTTIEILDAVIKKTSYLSLYDESDPEEKNRLENIKELRSVAVEFPNLIDFLQNVALVEQESMPIPQNPDQTKPGKKSNGKEEKKEAITFMTLHAAKGLEFRMVFMVGMEEGLFPHSQSLLDNHEIEEERRLCYVGLTRAREKLFLLYAKRRLFFGQRTQNMVSRFVYELPKNVLEKNFINPDPFEPEFL